MAAWPRIANAQSFRAAAQIPYLFTQPAGRPLSRKERWLSL